jgi:hypothetical protein
VNNGRLEGAAPVVLPVVGTAEELVVAIGVIEDELVEVGIKRFDEVELVLLLVLDEEDLAVGSAVVVGWRVTPNLLAYDSLSRPCTLYYY